MVLKRIGKIAIGCFGIIIILIILGVIFSGVIIQKLITRSVQDKTGVEVNVSDTNNSNLTYTDPKTGAKLNIGGNTIPENFPKDFPVYPNSTVTTSMSGDGYWLSLTTTDSLSNVITYYQTNLSQNGWDTKATQGVGQTNWAVTKNDLTGYVAISTHSASSGQANPNETSIVIVLGDVQE